MTPREVGEEGMKGIGSLIGSFAVPVGDSLGWDGSHGLGATLHEIPSSAGVWTTEKDYRHVYTARWRASASASASDIRLIGVFSETPYYSGVIKDPPSQPPPKRVRDGA